MQWSWVVLIFVPVILAKQVWDTVHRTRLARLGTGLVAIWGGLGLIGIYFGTVPVVIGALVAVFVLGAYILRVHDTIARQQHQVIRYREVAVRRADQVAVLSHEIRTPLALIKGASELLAEQTPGPLNEQQVRFVKTITDNSSAMNLLAEDLLLQARIDAGLFELRLDRVDLRKLAQRIVKDLREVNGLTVYLDCPGAPPFVWADASLIKQAITNLINNACAASGTKIGSARGTVPENPSQVMVRIHSRDDDALISVTDRGTGMTPAERQKIFDRFASGKPLRDGTGLGLTITQQIIAMHGGTIHVSTTARQGTTMMFTLPLEGPVLPALEAQMDRVQRDRIEKHREPKEKVMSKQSL